MKNDNGRGCLVDIQPSQLVGQSVWAATATAALQNSNGLFFGFPSVPALLQANKKRVGNRRRERLTDGR
jgi:hypothetical protein